MGNVNSLLTQRLKKGDHSSKMATMAKQSANGQLTSFSGVFGVTELTDKERIFLESLLNDFAIDVNSISPDLQALISITSEVKAINNQAIILHGERIKRAHGILTRYRDGAFTAWLMAAYGNRQTPYNFWQYYEFYESLPKPLRPQIEAMPRQAVYALASREGSLSKKQKIVESYQGETKTELLDRIREEFPLDEADRRRLDVGENTIVALKRVFTSLKRAQNPISDEQQSEIAELLEQIKQLFQ